jgi:excisionase family DNA binding protein
MNLHNESKRLWTVNEVADYFKVSNRTVYRWISEGLLPVIRIGGHTTRIRQEDLETFINANRTEPGDTDDAER